MMLLAPMLPFMMLFPKENSFVAEIDSESDSRDAQAGESTLEPVPSRKRSCVSPFLSTEPTSQSLII